MDYLTLATNAHREGKVLDAIPHYQNHLNQTPQSVAGWLNYGTLLLTRTGDLKTAETCLRNAASLQPGNSTIELQLGIALASQDRLEEAIVFFGKGAAEGTPQAVAELVCALVRLGRISEAQLYADRFRQSSPRVLQAHYLAAWVAKTQGRLEEALDAVNDAVSLDPFYPIALGFRSLLLWQLGRREEFRLALQEMSALQTHAVASSWGGEKLGAAFEAWRSVRSEAKRTLGIDQKAPVNFISIRGGLGDQYFIASLLAAYRTENPNYPLVAILNKNANWHLVYQDSADLFLHVDNQVVDSFMTISRLAPDYPYTPHFPWIGSLVSVYNLREYSRCFMGLSLASRGLAPCIPKAIKNHVRAKFEAFGGLLGKSVLISNLSNSNPMMPNSWWESMIVLLKDAGYVVFQNMTNMYNPDSLDRLPSAIQIELPMEEAIDFVELCGYFISVRNGLCDLLGTANATMKVIHVKRRYAVNDRYPLAVWLDHQSGYSLRRCFETPCWEDINMEPNAPFSRDVVADWLE